MAQIKIYKVNEIFEVQHFLNGGIIGLDVSKGVEGLVGKKLTFTTPSFNYTFVAGASSDLVRFLEIKSQLETASSGALLVKQYGGKIAFIEATPSTGCIIAGGAGNTGNGYLGFDSLNSTVGKVYGSPFTSPAVAPYLIQSYSVNETTHVIYTYE